VITEAAMTQTFWLEPTSEVARGLRRYASGTDFTCGGGYHSALVYLDRVPVTYRGDGERRHLAPLEPFDRTDPRWPTTCHHCAYEFTETNTWQDWQELIYRRTSDGQDFVLHSTAGADVLGAPAAPPGATWDAWWMPSAWKNRDGRYLMVRLPDGHDWAVDSRASNCGLPLDNEHRCWVRHGDPRECHVTVDKDGPTCSAGAGSIQSPNWHGFLRDGVLA
jgi:hypothetical protein